MNYAVQFLEQFRHIRRATALRELLVDRFDMIVALGIPGDHRLGNERLETDQDPPDQDFESAATFIP